MEGMWGYAEGAWRGSKQLLGVQRCVEQLLGACRVVQSSC